MVADRTSAPRRPPSGDHALIVHASCVVCNRRAALLRGGTGSGKSALALQLLALGGGLVADDRTQIWREGETLMADAPATIRGLIEARGIGILNAPAAGPAPVGLIVDMDRPEPRRLPEFRETRLLGVAVPLVGKTDGAHLPAAILTYLRYGRYA